MSQDAPPSADPGPAIPPGIELHLEEGNRHLRELGVDEELVRRTIECAAARLDRRRSRIHLLVAAFGRPVPLMLAIAGSIALGLGGDRLYTDATKSDPPPLGDGLHTDATKLNVDSSERYLDWANASEIVPMDWPVIDVTTPDSPSLHTAVTKPDPALLSRFSQRIIASEMAPTGWVVTAADFKIDRADAKRLRDTLATLTQSNADPQGVVCVQSAAGGAFIDPTKCTSEGRCNVRLLSPKVERAEAATPLAPRAPALLPGANNSSPAPSPRPHG